MNRIWFAAPVLFLLATAEGFPQMPAPNAAPLSTEALAAILGQTAGASCPNPQQGVVLAARRQGSLFKACSATATCNDTSGTPVSCTFGGVGGTCTFQNQDCAAFVDGFVNCNGTVTSCPRCDCGGRVVCCTCERTGDCFACCRCDGGTIRQCRDACS